MMYQFEYNQLCRLLQEAAEAAARRTIDDYVRGNMLSEREVIRRFRAKGYKQCFVYQLIEQGILEGKRMSEAIGSKKLYRESDVILALRAAETNHFLRKPNNNKKS